MTQWLDEVREEATAVRLMYLITTRQRRIVRENFIVEFLETG